MDSHERRHALFAKTHRERDTSIGRHGGHARRPAFVDVCGASAAHDRSIAGIYWADGQSAFRLRA